MQPVRARTIDVKDGWAALAHLERLCAADDPMAMRAFGSWGWRRTPAEIHQFVRGRVRYITGRVQRWATPARTLSCGYGDCGNSARAVVSLARFHGYPARIRAFVARERVGLFSQAVYPAHVCAQIWDGQAWRWCECVVPAEFGEHPLEAARRLGVRTTLEELPARGERAGVMHAVEGPWPYQGFPDRIQAMGALFSRARWAWPYPGTVAQYRQESCACAMHLHVLDTPRGRRWRVDHRDHHNPDRGSAVAHLVRDVLPAATIGSMDGTELPPTKTPTTAADMSQALYNAWTDARDDTPTLAQLEILLAQWAVETDMGKSMVQFSVGNVKKVNGDGHDWTQYPTTEGTGASKVHVTQPFVAYPSLDAGAASYFARFQQGGPNAGAWNAVLTADVDAFAEALKSERYYTASEQEYDAALRARLSQLEALNLPDPGPPSGGPIVAGVVIAIGLGAAWATGYLPSWREVLRAFS